MRIIRARQLVEMLSPWRKTAGWADWKIDDDLRFPVDSATLENGHRLSVGKSFLTDGAWGYQIYGPPTEEEEWPKIAESPVHGEKEFPHLPDKWSHDRLTREQARDAAEKHYEQLFPLGTDTGSHDSGVDYDDIMRNYKDYL